MNIAEEGIYHIYNRGNNQQPIFFNDRNYLYFIQKCHQYLKPISEVLAWCLMRNHFHFLIEITEESLKPVRSGGIIMPAISNGFRLLQSSYAKGINKQENRTGNLFQQKTKAKLVSSDPEYPLAAFLYIHLNPVSAGLIKDPVEWEYSSWKEYTGPRNNTLCNLERGRQLLKLNELDLITEALKKIDEQVIKKIL